MKTVKAAYPHWTGALFVTEVQADCESDDLCPACQMALRHEVMERFRDAIWLENCLAAKLYVDENHGKV